MAYMIEKRVVIEDVGFIQHPTLMAGASPDGLVSLDGGIEIKSVIPVVQIETIDNGGYPQTHKTRQNGIGFPCSDVWQKLPENI